MSRFNLFGKFLGFGGWKTKITAILGATSIFWWPPLAAAVPDQYEPAILMTLAAIGITGVGAKLEKNDTQNKLILEKQGVPVATQPAAIKGVEAKEKAIDAAK